MADTVQRIKETLSIIDVVGPYVKLQKAGKYWKGLSPFNKEKTPSFFVNPDRGTYYCFSSSQGGDMFSFIEKMEGLDFKGALKVLAEKAGIEVVYEQRGTTERDNEERFRQAMAAAERYFSSLLTKESEAYEYALSRGLTEETIRAWNLGFAPLSWRGLLEALTQKGFSLPELLSVGLIKEADEKKGTYYDRFRNRLMFPIRDGAGRTVAFTGRALSPDDQAKYLNSPETPLFKKSQILFGMDKAKDSIRSRGFALLVEGQFDLVLLHQIGFTNTIALSGTALSKAHLTLIKRYGDNLMLALDADRAGLSASAKNAHAALLEGMRVKAVRLPLGKDPADLAKDTPQDFARRLKEAESIVEFFLSVLSATEKDMHRLVVSVERVVLPLVKVMRSPLEREHFVGIIARTLGSTSEAVRESLMRVKEEPSEPDEKLPEELVEKPSDTPLEKRRLMLLAAAGAYPDTGLEKRIKNEYARIVGVPPQLDELSEEALFQAGIAFGEHPSDDAADDLLRAFEQAVLTEALEEAVRRLRKAESAKDEAGITASLKASQELSKRLGSFS
jgi:DNA primase